MICPLCNKDFKFPNYKSHFNKCTILHNHSSDIIHDYVDNLLTTREIEIKYKINFTLLKRFLQSKSINIRTKSEALKVKTKPRPKHTIETKTKLSKIRTQYLMDNPDKHPWKSNAKFKSAPCEHLKTILRQHNISFVDEYMPNIDCKLYSIDIAFPDKKLGIEINGNQHYNSDGTLKEYYKNRHNIICNGGWRLYEYHYSLVYNKKFITDVINTLKTTFELGLVDYSFYIKEKRIKKQTIKTIKSNIKTTKVDTHKYIKTLNRTIHLCIDGCGSIVYKKGDRCRNCFDINRRKIVRPPYEQLKSEVSNMSYVALGKKYGVSDNAIRKWIKYYEKKV